METRALSNYPRTGNKEVLCGVWWYLLAQQVGPQFQPIHNNARSHTARLVRTFLEENEVILR